MSLATASKALSPHPDRCDLHPDTRARIVAAARELGWSRDQPRSARARRKWHNVGMLWGYRVPPFSGSYESVSEALSQVLGDDFRLLLTPVPTLKDWHELQLSLRLDGAIVMGHVEDGILADMERAGYPAVLLNLESPRNLHQLLVDDIAGAGALATHLVELGHRRIVLLGNPWEPGHYSERDRPLAIRRVAADAGMTVEEIRGRHFDQVVERCRAGATAVICMNWQDVAEVRMALRQADLAVPSMVSVTACHDISWFRHFDPPITAIEVPLRRMAEIGARILLDLIAGRPVESDVRQVLPETLAIRGSSAAPTPRKPSRESTPRSRT